MSGGGGDDEYYLDNPADTVSELGNDGFDTVHSRISWTMSNNVERLYLEGIDNLDALGNAGDNVIYGNNGNNRLYGGDGNDVLTGGGGIDFLRGGNGDDTYHITLADSAIEDNIDASGGHDTVYSWVDGYTLELGIEDLVIAQEGISGSGNDLDNAIYGNWGSETLYGGEGNDYLYGGPAGNDTMDGGAGADRMAGGFGSDVYYVDNTGDSVEEVDWDNGVDTVAAGISYTLGNYVETLILQGSANLNGTGNALDNALLGNSGKNVLNGGAGGDAMNGGDGDDSYYVDNLADITRENTDLASGGSDTVFASVSHGIGHGIEKLVLTGGDNIDGFGNLGNNTLTGNAGANFLDGNDGNDALNGGAGNDQLFGGAGNDTLDGGGGADSLWGAIGNDIYIVDNVGDSVGEDFNGGTDTVKASVDYTLTDNVENLTLTGGAAINGGGNSLDNTLIGNSANNSLNGGDGHDVLDGGSGADTLIGGQGNDKYYVNAGGDNVVELAGGGTDLVNSLISYALGANLENLRLTGSAGIDGSGNELNNYLTGNGAANKLFGLAGIDTLDGGNGNDALDGGNGNDVLIGGQGSDLLIGAAGADRFDFNSMFDSLLGGNRDVISDFSSAQGDKIDLASLDANTGLTGNQAFSFIGSAEFTGAGQIRFDAATGAIQCNVDGSLSADFEIGLTGVSVLQAADFIL